MRSSGPTREPVTTMGGLRMKLGFHCVSTQWIRGFMA